MGQVPSGTESVSLGKKMDPILTYEVTVGDTKRIVAKTKGPKGAIDDKTAGQLEIVSIILKSNRVFQ